MSRGDPTYSRISPRFWATAQDEDWTDDMVLLGLYLLTCSHRTTEGIFRLPREYMIADLPGRWDAARLYASLDALVRNGFVMYDEKARVVFLPHAMKYQRPDNENQWKAAIKHLRSLPETCLFRPFSEAAEKYAKGFAQALREDFPQAFTQDYTDPPAPAPAPLTHVSDSEDAPVDNSNDGFEDFWKTYPRHVGRSAARKCWSRLSASDRTNATQAAKHLCDYVTASGTELRFVPHPATFIGPKRTFEDWANDWPDGYGNNGSAKKSPQCECGTDLTYDEIGLHCPQCGRREDSAL